MRLMQFWTVDFRFSIAKEIRVDATHGNLPRVARLTCRVAHDIFKGTDDHHNRERGATASHAAEE